MKSHFILYVRDQQRSTNFYWKVLGLEPRLNVPGMTEFVLHDSTVLGLMPESSAERLLGIKMNSLHDNQPPRAELYLIVDDAAPYHARALAAGANEISPLIERDWGHRAAYSVDHDGHVLAFAEDHQ